MKRLICSSLVFLSLVIANPVQAVEKSSNQWSVKQKILFVGLTPIDQPGLWIGGNVDSESGEVDPGMGEYVKTIVSNSMKFWIDNSYGNMKFSSPQFIFGKPGTSIKRCNSNADIQSGMKVAGLKSIPKGTHLVVANVNDTCGYAGLGSQFGNSVNLVSLTSTVLAHELGHNFGFRHSSVVYCKNSDYSKFNSTFCKVDEYGDFRDIMGNDEWCPNTTLGATQRATIFGTPLALDVKIGSDITIDQSQNRSLNTVYQLKYQNNWYFFEYYNPGKEHCMIVSSMAYGPQLQVRMIGPKWITSAGMSVGPTLLLREDSDLPAPGVTFQRDGVEILKPSDGWTLTGFVAGESFKLPGAPFVLTVKSTGLSSAVFVVSKN